MSNTKKAAQERHDGGVAIVGMAGRFPGAPNVKEFWRNLLQGVEAIHFASDEELSAAGVDAGTVSNPDYVRASSTIRDPEFFDASFFGFSAREAEIIDPQHRLFLECAWEALEDAGYDPATCPGSIGVFAGAGMNSYGVGNLLTNPEIMESVGAYQIMVGNDKDFLCSRVSYKLNLRGPSVGLQTACSTSLVAVQMAFESLLRDECDMALAGGVSIPLPQPSGYLYVPGMILSRDGHCRAFDAAASGTVPGAGAGVVLLKRLQKAIEDRDHIYAVIHGAAVNNDGSDKAGYSAPSVEGQCGVIRKSLEMAGFAPESIGYIEAHGTGTEVGDPIEVAALSKVFQTPTMHARSCALGSVKTNIGHLDVAAGIVGLIKTALMLYYRAIPPTLHFKQPNPLIDFAKTPFYVNNFAAEFDGAGPLRAGVSSFGIGGTNAHVSLEEAPQVTSDPVATSQLVVLSAKSATALENQAARLTDYLEENPSANLADVAFTLQKGRPAFRHRRVLVTRDIAELTRALQSFRLPSPGSQLLRTDNAPNSPVPVAFLFPGQGAQYVNMGRGLYETAPVFRDTLDRCCKLLESHLNRDLRGILYPPSGEEDESERLLAQTSITQPAVFAIEYAMAMLWMDCGVEPTAMIGHSVGEYVAACIAGVFSLEDALALIAARGRLIQSMPAGAMLAVNLSEQDVAPLLSSELSLAAVNSQDQTVVSGAEDAIAALESKLKSKKIDCKRLRTSHAFHSQMMDPVVEDYIDRVAQVQMNFPKLRFLSNVTGKWITDLQATDAAYWGKHLRSTVRFADCARNLIRETNSVLLEVGPGDTLLSLVRLEIEACSAAGLISSMRHRHASQADRDVWLTAAGRLWLSNVRLSWDGLHRDQRRMRLSLPTYPFERQRYWIEPARPSAIPDIAPLAKQPNIADWFYFPSWKRSPAELLQRSRIEASQTSLVFIGEGPLGASVAAELDAHGPVVRVQAGVNFRKVSREVYEIDAANREDYLRLIQDLQANDLWPARIVHAWMLDASPEWLLQRTLNLGVLSAMFLAQAVEESSSTRPVELNVLSNRAYSLLGEPALSPASVALHSFCGVIALECPNIVCRVIDVDSESNMEMVRRQIAQELLCASCNEVVAYRGAARWKQYYEPVRFEKSADLMQSNRSIGLRNRGAYIITGGLGGVGLVLARYLAQTAQARIVFISRTGFPAESEWQLLLDVTGTADVLRKRLAALQSIRDLGGEVMVLQADVADPVAMRQALSVSRAKYGAIHGIIHAAGIAGAGMVQTKSRDQAMAILAPKVHGTQWICECLGTPELDFVLLCSSISAVAPSVGLSDYAAANAYMDGFAAAFDNPNLTRVISANWDTWKEVGMAVDIALPGALAHLREERLQHAILSREAEEVFARLLSQPMPQVVISTRKLDSLQRQAEAEIMAFRNGAQSPSKETMAVHIRTDSLENYAAAEDEIERFIVDTWQELLGVEPIGIHDDFFQLGGHSLLGTRVVARMRKRFKVDLSLRMIFEAATPAELAQRVRQMSGDLKLESPDSTLEREEIEI
jgi:acyl transferase domain-containing protein